MGVSRIVTIFIRNKSTSYEDRFLDKLELKYGNIDRKKVIKLDNIYEYLISGALILIGILIRDSLFALRATILTLVVSTIVYYLIRKRYILIDKL